MVSDHHKANWLAPLSETDGAADGAGAASPGEGTAGKPDRLPPIPRIPPILLEGDCPSPLSEADLLGSLGWRDLEWLDDEPESALDTSGLPNAYGTEQISLLARDPHWLYAHWDFGSWRLQTLNRRARDGHLCLLTYKGTAREWVAETAVHPESIEWFLPVASGGEEYLVEIGLWRSDGLWESVGCSNVAWSPWDGEAQEQEVWHVKLGSDQASGGDPGHPASATVMISPHRIRALPCEPAPAAAFPVDFPLARLAPSSYEARE